MKFGKRFVGFDPGTRDDWAAYAELTKLPDDTLKLKRILHVPPVPKELRPGPR